MSTDSAIDVARSDDPPRVTVLVMTYNHANFIARALDSTLAHCHVRNPVPPVGLG